MADAKPSPAPEGATGVLVLADGSVIWGRGFGAEGEAVGEVCFNTAMTGYQEIMTDPSYAAQIVTFTFPHIGNVGANYEDLEADNPWALGCVVRQDVTEPSNFRAVQSFADWMRANGRIGLSGVDTRALTRKIRERGRAQRRDRPRRGRPVRPRRPARQGAGLAGARGDGPGEGGVLPADVPLVRRPLDARPGLCAKREEDESRPHVVAIDYGSKRNIFRNLADAGARVTVLPATATFEEVMAHEPDGFFLSNGPGDPAATGEYAVPVIRQLLETGKPLFGICLGHQLLGLAVGAKTVEDAPGPPRRQPPGQAPRRRPGRDHQHEPRLRGRDARACRPMRGRPTSACSTAACAGSS